MSDVVQRETHSFQTEVQQLLHLMINNLYSDKQIFVRELISNASDALDKLRVAALRDNSLNTGNLAIKVAFDRGAHTITFTDNGIGMTREEVIANLGTIARSGTKEFLQKMTPDQAKDSHFIGQFGVGFYSAFIVADKVTVTTRSYEADVDHGVRWESTADGNYTLEQVEKKNRGTTVVLHLKDTEHEFLDDYRLRNIIRTYSDHISFPIHMDKALTEDDLKKSEAGEVIIPEEETVNKATALWTRPKAEITEEEYKEFYKHISHDFDDPLDWTHNRVEGAQDYVNLLFIPKRAPFDMWNRERRQGVRLYVKRVFIMDDAEQFLPPYLRFVRGVIDANDLPLNVSREILQQNRLVDTIRAGSVKKILGLLENLAKNHPEKYLSFWKEFGEVMKEGPGEDFANKEQIAKLLRFATTHTDTDEQNVSLDDYISRMKEGQDKIYYISAESFLAAKNSPQIEVFRQKGIEIILLFHRVDEWLTSQLTEYAGKKFESVAKGRLDLGKLEDETEKQAQEQDQKEYKDLVDMMKDTLKDKVKDVRITHRLTQSPACIVADDHDLGLQMQRILEQAGQKFPSSKPILELNPHHPVVERLKQKLNSSQATEWAFVLLDQAILADGGHLEDPVQFVHRLNRLFLEMKD